MSHLNGPYKQINYNIDNNYGVYYYKKLSNEFEKFAKLSERKVLWDEDEILPTVTPSDKVYIIVRFK